MIISRQPPPVKGERFSSTFVALNSEPGSLNGCLAHRAGCGQYACAGTTSYSAGRAVPLAAFSDVSKPQSFELHEPKDLMTGFEEGKNRDRCNGVEGIEFVLGRAWPSIITLNVFAMYQ